MAENISKCNSVCANFSSDGDHGEVPRESSDEIQCKRSAQKGRKKKASRAKGKIWEEDGGPSRRVKLTRSRGLKYGEKRKTVFLSKMILEALLKVPKVIFRRDSRYTKGRTGFIVLRGELEREFKPEECGRAVDEGMGA